MMEMIKLNQRKRPLVGGRRWSSWLAALEGFTNEFERKVEVKIWIQQMQYRESQRAERCPENSWLADQEIFTNVFERLAPIQIRIQDRDSKIYFFKRCELIIAFSCWTKTFFTSDQRNERSWKLFPHHQHLHHQMEHRESQPEEERPGNKLLREFCIAFTKKLVTSQLALLKTTKVKHQA